MRKYVGKIKHSLALILAISIFLSSTSISSAATTEHIIFHHTDHLSGTNIDTDENGNILEAVDYYPYGEVRIDQKSTTYENKHKFTGKELDKSDNLYYYGARYYDPSIGRFISQDPADGDPSNPQSLNKYSYVMNNPLKYVDPSGAFAVNTFLTGLTQLGVMVLSVLGASAQAGGALVSGPVLGTALMAAATNNLVDSGSNFMSGMENIARACDNKSPVDYSFNPAHNLIDNYVGNGTLNTGLHAGYTIFDIVAGAKGLTWENGSIRTWEESGLLPNEANRIQGTANAINKSIYVVGSRAKGTATTLSDWDYLVEESLSRQEKKLMKSFLPKGSAGGELNGVKWSGRDIFNETLRRTEEYIPFHPKN